jgi:hypothetical protein
MRPVGGQSAHSPLDGADLDLSSSFRLLKRSEGYVEPNFYNRRYWLPFELSSYGCLQTGAWQW